MDEEMDSIRPRYSRYQWAVRYNIDSAVDFALFVSRQDADDFIEQVLAYAIGQFEVVSVDHTVYSGE